MLHSTGANNPWLRRFVGPDDGLLGANLHNNHWNQDRPGGRLVCVHAFIGRLADGSIATYQTLPWNHRGWHCGRAARGSGNDTHISFEICEDNLSGSAYFRQVYAEATRLCVYLCRTVGAKEKHFCSDKCRMIWWSAHPEVVNRQALHPFTCAHCGEHCQSYSKKNRKYCSRACYGKARAVRHE